MHTQPINSTVRAPAGLRHDGYVAGGGRRERALFDGIGRPPDAHDPLVVRQTGEQLVSQVFFGPLLAEMRKLPFGRGIGGGGRGEEVFGEQLDQRLADAVASRGGGGLVDAVARALTAPGAQSESGGTAERARLVGAASWRTQLQAIGAGGALQRGAAEPWRAGAALPGGIHEEESGK